MALEGLIIKELEEAGRAKGLTVKELVQRIMKKKLWDWKNEKLGYMSVFSVCSNKSDVFVKVAPATYSLQSLQEGGQGLTLKSAVITVLEAAGQKGLTIKEMVQRIKKKFSWDWKDDKTGYNSVAAACCEASYRGVFVRVAPGAYALWSLQDDDFDPNEKPKTLKETIINVLQDAGPEGLHVKELVQRIKKKFSWDWKDDKAGYNSVAAACCEASNRGVFVRVASGTYALKSQRPQGGRGRGRGTGTKRSNQRKHRSMLPKPGRPRKMRRVEECIIKPYKHVLEVAEDGRIVLFSDEYLKYLKCVNQHLTHDGMGRYERGVLTTV